MPGKVIGDDGKETMNCGESENWRCYCCGALCDVCIASRGASGQLALSGPIQLCVKKNSNKKSTTSSISQPPFTARLLNNVAYASISTYAYVPIF